MSRKKSQAVKEQKADDGFSEWASQKPEGASDNVAEPADILEREPITTDASAEPESKPRRKRAPREDDLMDLASKAKTKLKLIRKGKQVKLDALRAAIAGLNEEFDKKEDEFLASLGDDVKTVLRAGGVIQ